MIKTSADLPTAKATAKQLIIANKIYEPPVPVMEFVQKEGLSIYSAEFAEQIIIAGFIDLDKHQIILNEMDDQPMQSFTLARALGHWLMHREELEEIPELKVIYQQSLGGELKNFYERETYYFAIHLLVPEDFLVQDKQLSDEALVVKYNVPEFVIKRMRKELKD